MKKKTKMCKNCKAHIATEVHHIDGNHDNNDPKNLMQVCAFCHAVFENRSPNLAIAKVEYENLKDLENTRIRLGNRIQGLKKWGIDTKLLEEEVKIIKKLERKTEKNLIETVKDKKILGWITKIRGIADKTAAELIALIGEIKRFDTISSLWHYSGLHVENGEAPKLRKKKKISYHPKLKSLCLGIMGQNLIRLRSSYRRFYDEKKKYYEENRNWTKMHRHRAAIRYMTKQFIKDLWLQWRELENLPITNAHPQDQTNYLLKSKLAVNCSAVGGDANRPDLPATETQWHGVPSVGRSNTNSQDHARVEVKTTAVLHNLAIGDNASGLDHRAAETHVRGTPPAGILIKTRGKANE